MMSHELQPVAISISVITTVLCLPLHYIEFATCNLYNNKLVKSTNQFLQCRSMTVLYYTADNQ